MFTGISEETGIILALGNKLTVSAKKVLEDIHIGDSIAVNGICLTVTDFDNKSFKADAMPETFNRTALGQLKVGSRVNLERAMPANGRFGGHIVSGHIDGTGKVINYRIDGNAIWLTIQADKALLKYIAPKGSVAIDGISLTVVDSLQTTFTVSLIPHTAQVTSITDHKAGDLVNIETDVLAKYAERLLSFKDSRQIDMDFLSDCGF